MQSPKIWNWFFVFLNIISLIIRKIMKELYIFFILFIGLLFGAGVLTVIVLYFRSFVRFLWGTSEKCFFLKKKPLSRWSFIKKMLWIILLPIWIFYFSIALSDLNIRFSWDEVMMLITLPLIFMTHPLVNFLIESRRMDADLGNKWIKYISLILKVIINISILVAIYYFFWATSAFVSREPFAPMHFLVPIFAVAIHISLLFVIIIVLSCFPSIHTPQQTKENP